MLLRLPGNWLAAFPFLLLLPALMTLSFKPLAHSAEVLRFLRVVGEQESTLFRPKCHHCVNNRDVIRT